MKLGASMKFEQAVVTDRKKILRVDRGQVRAHKKESARFVVLLTRGVLVQLSAKRVITARRRIILPMFAERDCGILGGKTVHAVAESEGSDDEDDLLTFSVDSSDECPSQDEWHVSFKIADTNVNFKIDSGADCNVISKSLFDRLPVDPKQARQCKAKLKVYDGRRITPSGKVSLTCEYKGKFTVIDFVLVEQDLPSILGLKSSLDLGLIKRNLPP